MPWPFAWKGSTHASQPRRPRGLQVYFVHGYAADVGPDTLASSEHGKRFAAIVQRDHVSGAQFHPERSGPVGLRLLANFLGVA
jgi:glutamine amidotransferase